MPEEDIPEGKDVISRIEDIKSLTDEQRNNIRELFENLEVIHESLACSCGLPGMLPWSLTSRQLLLLMKTSFCPLI